MTLPQQYADLALEPAPRLLLEALKLYGTREIVGGQHSPEIMGWLRELGFTWIRDDETAWCGTALAIAAVRAGVAIRNPEMPRAFWWEGWGIRVLAPMLGDVMIFDFSHVGIYVGEDATHYHSLGGNQGNQHNIVRFPKNTLKAARRTPWKIGQPQNVRRIPRDAHGAPTNTSTR